LLDEPVGHRPLDEPARRGRLDAGIRRGRLDAGIRRRWLDAAIWPRWLDAATRHPWFTALGAGAGFMVLASVIFILPKQHPSAMMTDCGVVPCTAPGGNRPSGHVARPRAIHGLSGPATPPAGPSPAPAASTIPAAVPSPMPSAPPAATPPSVTVTYALITRWDGGLMGEFTITNYGRTDITGWELTAKFPGDQIQDTWGPAGTDTDGDTLVMEAEPDWPEIAPGTSQSGYFVARGDTTFPSNCTFNGAACPN